MDNRAGEMEILVASLEHGSFSAAARRFGMTPSAVAKLVTRLETRLGTRLLLRSTRKLVPTPEGELYLTRARAILADLDDAERAVADGAGAAPRGRLKVTASAGFGESVLLPLVPAFLERYDRVELDLSIHDRIVDLFDERADVALRSGPLPDSSLSARKILETTRVVVASPAYLARRGTPRHPDELAGHNCLGFNFHRSMSGWPFLDPETGREWQMANAGNALLDSGPSLRRLCLMGLGIGRVGRLYAEPQIAAGTLVPILEAFNPGDIETVNALFVRHDHMAARVRAFVDFLAQAIRERAERL